MKYYLVIGTILLILVAVGGLLHQHPLFGNTTQIVGIVVASPDVNRTKQVIQDTQGKKIYYAISGLANAETRGMIQQLPNADGVIVPGGDTDSDLIPILTAYIQAHETGAFTIEQI